MSTESVNQQSEADPTIAPMAVAHKLSPRTLRFLNSGTAEGTRVRRRKMAAAVSKKRLSGEYASIIRSTCLYMATTCALASRSTARVVPTRTAGAPSTPPQDLQKSAKTALPGATASQSEANLRGSRRSALQVASTPVTAGLLSFKNQLL